MENLNTNETRGGTDARHCVPRLVRLSVAPMFRWPKNEERGKSILLDIFRVRIAMGVSTENPTWTFFYRVRSSRKTGWQVRVGPFSAGLLIHKPNVERSREGTPKPNE